LLRIPLVVIRLVNNQASLIAIKLAHQAG